MGISDTKHTQCGIMKLSMVLINLTQIILCSKRYRPPSRLGIEEPPEPDPKGTSFMMDERFIDHEDRYRYSQRDFDSAEAFDTDDYIVSPGRQGEGVKICFSYTTVPGSVDFEEDVHPNLERSHTKATSDSSYETDSMYWEEVMRQLQKDGLSAFQAEGADVAVDGAEDEGQKGGKLRMTAVSMKAKQRHDHYQPGFFSLGWTFELTGTKLKELYSRLTRRWRGRLDLKQIEICDHKLTRFLSKNPDTVKGLLNDDEKTWTRMQDYCDPENILRRISNPAANVKGKNKHPHLTRVNWMAGQIPSQDKDIIMNRLKEYWQIDRGAKLYSRLAKYAKRFGKIQSPEWLLGNDQARFEYAANIIHYPSLNWGEINPEAGFHDVLHRYGPKYGVMGADGQPIFQPYESSQLRPKAPRYNTGQEWMVNVAPAEINRIHQSIARHWSERVYASLRTDLLCIANNYLENHRKILNAIQSNDEDAAWIVARAMVSEDKYMRTPWKMIPAHLCQDD